MSVLVSVSSSRFTLCEPTRSRFTEWAMKRLERTENYHSKQAARDNIIFKQRLDFKCRSKTINNICSIPQYDISYLTIWKNSETIVVINEISCKYTDPVRIVTDELNRKRDCLVTSLEATGKEIKVN